MKKYIVCITAVLALIVAVNVPSVRGDALTDFTESIAGASDVRGDIFEVKWHGYKMNIASANDNPALAGNDLGKVLDADRKYIEVIFAFVSGPRGHRGFIVADLAVAKEQIVLMDALGRTYESKVITLASNDGVNHVIVSGDAPEVSIDGLNDTQPTVFSIIYEIPEELRMADLKIKIDGKSTEPKILMYARACGSSVIGFSTKTDKNQHPAPEPEAGRSIVYVLRPPMAPDDFTAFAMDGNWQGTTTGKDYFYFSADPGEHMFCSRLTVKSQSGGGAHGVVILRNSTTAHYVVFEATLKPDTAYFIEPQFPKVVVSKRYSHKLVPVSEDVGREKIKKLGYRVNK